MKRSTESVSRTAIILLLLTVSMISIALAPPPFGQRTSTSPQPVSATYPQPTTNPTGTTTNTVTSFITPPAWTNAAPIPTPREGYGAAGINGIFYYITGYGPSGDTTVNEAYNASSNTWTTKASLPSTPRSETVAVTDGKYVYLIGGRPVTSVGHDLWRYNPADDTWTSLTPMPTARATEHMAVYYNGRIYVAGGRFAEAPTEGGSLATLEIYDIASNTWATGAPMPQPLADGSALLLNGKMYIFGGFTNGLASSTTFVYDISSDSWITASPSPVGAVDPAVGACGPLVYMIGGSSAFLNLQTSNYAYDPASDTWNTSLPIPVPTAEVQAISYNGQVYVTGGGIFGSGATNPVNQVFHCVNNQLLVSPAIQPARPAGSNVTYAIKVANFQPFTSWDIMVEVNASMISPQTISIGGNLFQANFTATVTQTVNCVNGIGAGCGPGDGPGIVHSAGTVQGAVPGNTTLSGLLFTITYKSFGGTFSPVTLLNDRVLSSAGSPLVHSSFNGVYGKPPPDFQLSAFPAHLLVGKGSSGTTSIIAESLNSFSGSISLTATVSPLGPTVSFSTNPLPVLANQTALSELTVSSTDQLSVSSNYTITITGSASNVSHTIRVSITIVPDFSITVAPSTATLVPGQPFTATVLLTSRDFSGFLSLSTSISPSTVDSPDMFLNQTSVGLTPGQSAQTTLFVFTFVTTPPDNYTITVTATGQISHSTSLVLNLLPPILTLSPSQGQVGTRITVQGSRFPFYQNGGTDSIYVSFDDMNLGFVPLINGTFTFVLDAPLSQAGQHTIRAHDYNTGAHRDASFIILPTINPLSVSVQVGTIYFPGDTAVVTILVTQPGGPGPAGVNLQVTLTRPDGSSTALPTTVIALGLARASYTVPNTGLIGTYAVLVKATSAGQPATALQTFEVKLTWLTSNAGGIAGAITVAGVLGLVGVVAWKKGYLRSNRNDDEIIS